MEDTQKEGFFKNDGIQTRAKVWMHTMYSEDIDEINVRLKETDISKIEFAKSVYEEYEATKKKTKSSLNNYCWVLSFKMKIKPPRFYKNWYLIYRHFCVRSQIDPYDLIGIDYKFLKYIAESGPNTMSIEVTENAVDQLKKYPQKHSKKWEYIRDLKKLMKEIYTTIDP